MGKYRPLPIGVDDFKQLVESNYYFVDKTLLIKDLLDKKGLVNLFARPRRFGKSLNLSMLRYFFEDARDAVGNKIDTVELFSGLAVLQSGEEYQKHMGRYPVIMLS